MDERGFTLIELVLTILLVAIVVGLSISMMNNVSDASRYEQTRKQLDAIQVSILGDNSINSQGHRLNFGYVGDWGSLPGALSNLTTAQAPAWSYNTTYGFGAGWKGSYLSSQYNNITVTNDAWGNAFTYAPAASPATVTSLGADGAAGGTLYNKDLALQIPTTAWRATVYGTVLNGSSAVSGATVEIRYPQAGTITAFTTVSAANGSFSFLNVPFGVHSIAVTSAPTLGPVQIIVDNAYTNLSASTLNYGSNTVPPIIILDASLGNGAGFPGLGCGTTIWADTSNNRDYGILKNFGGLCLLQGWSGLGVAASPYNLTFNSGSSNYVALPENLLQGLKVSTIEMWFSSTSTGTLLGMNNAGLTNWDPVLYIGTDNFLHAEMWTGSVSPIANGSAINNGVYHFAVLTMATNTQSLYIDDTLIGTLAGAITNLDMNLNQLGYSKTTTFPNAPGGNTYLTGSIAYFAIYNVASLSTVQIKSDCLNLVSRFSGAVCN